MAQIIIGDYNSMPRQVQENKENIERLGESVADIDGDLATLKTEVQANTSNIQKNTTDISSNTESITNIEAELAQLEPTVSAHTTAIANINTVNEQQNTKIANLEKYKINFKGFWTENSSLAGAQDGDCYILAYRFPTNLRIIEDDTYITGSMSALKIGKLVIRINGYWNLIDDKQSWQLFTGGIQKQNVPAVIYVVPNAASAPEGTYYDNKYQVISPEDGGIYATNYNGAERRFLKLAPYGSSSTTKKYKHNIILRTNPTAGGWQGEKWSAPFGDSGDSKVIGDINPNIVLQFSIISDNNEPFTDKNSVFNAITINSVPVIVSGYVNNFYTNGGTFYIYCIEQVQLKSSGSLLSVKLVNFLTSYHASLTLINFEQSDWYVDYDGIEEL